MWADIMKNAMTILAFDSKWLEKMFLGVFPEEVLDNLIPIKSDQKFYAETLQLWKARDNNLCEETEQ